MSLGIHRSPPPFLTYASCVHQYGALCLMYAGETQIFYQLVVEVWVLPLFPSVFSGPGWLYGGQLAESQSESVCQAVSLGVESL